MSQTFVYIVENEPYVGTIGDYAKAVENAHYSGLRVDNTVWTVNEETGAFEPTKVTFSSSGYDEDDYGYTTISIEFAKNDPEEAVIRIDGRA